MESISIFLLALLVMCSCTNGQNNRNNQAFATLPAPNPGEQVATFAGGCFWALQEGMSELKGVNTVVSGYAGGTVKNPSYEEVCSDATGHAESVQVYYDTAVISYATLAEAFFYAHDPTTLNRQGPDEGEDYRSMAFYRTEDEKKTLKAVIAKVNATHHYSDPIVTEVVPYKVLYPAEKYHQGYYSQHLDDRYIEHVSMPKVLKLRAAMGDKIKPEFRN